jgi:8-oxo-dGTP diphosphatase
MTVKRETGRGLVIDNGRIILMERWRDGLHYFSVPGGGVESGETPEEAAVRELYEELGIRVSVDRKVYEMHTDEAIHHIFLCEYHGGEPRLQPHAPEIIEHTKGDNRFVPRWVACESVATLPFLYWEPLRADLVEDLTRGFSVETKTITV